MNRTSVVLVCIIAAFVSLVCSIEPAEATHYTEQDALNHLLARIDSTAAYRLGSDYDLGGITGTIAANTKAFHYVHTCAANEYAILHQYRAGGGIVGVDYYLRLYATIVNAGGTDSTSAYIEARADAAETRIYAVDLLTGGQVIVVKPGETLHLKTHNVDDELDAIWYSYIVERVKFE